ncbi:hypothetical protein [Amycolatopsis saalfeldensis]|uniref:Uncharacterized protein n=1 Tax=Amycolatopsis saalfeldensis TaxID=394193 RepID=A0A1H8SHK9_9PSEU|nr:hypothetical protein [Amycolatopsis saalfeldensis]SEO77854.1 hypothetical protein SAMN04489732_102106 [Amycolatopsis saalfeldensis]
MFAAYLTGTLVTSVFTGTAATFYLIRHDYPLAQADAPIHVLGTAAGRGAGGGLILYFIGALAAHLRVGSRQLVGGVVFLALAAASLVLNLGSQTP